MERRMYWFAFAANGLAAVGNAAVACMATSRLHSTIYSLSALTFACVSAYWFTQAKD